MYKELEKSLKMSPKNFLMIESIRELMIGK